MELNDCCLEGFLPVAELFREKESPKVYSTGLTDTFDSTLGWAALVKNLERAAFLYELTVCLLDISSGVANVCMFETSFGVFVCAVVYDLLSCKLLLSMSPLFENHCLRKLSELSFTDIFKLSSCPLTRLRDLTKGLLAGCCSEFIGRTGVRFLDGMFAIRGLWRDERTGFSMFGVTVRYN